MARLSSPVSIALACSVCLFRLAAAADDPPVHKFGDKIPLVESDLRAITLQVLERYPLVASSPGIKFAEAHRAGILMPSGEAFDSASIVFYPHAASVGIKEAFQAHCRRVTSSESWTCDHVEIRRYVQLDSQDFEVRVKGNLSLEEVLALIQSTRSAVQAAATDGSAVPDTVMIVMPANGGYLVDWSSPGGKGGMTVEAHLVTDGNAATPGDWQTSFLPRE